MFSKHLHSSHLILIHSKIHCSQRTTTVNLLRHGGPAELTSGVRRDFIKDEVHRSILTLEELQSCKRVNDGAPLR